MDSLSSELTEYECRSLCQTIREQEHPVSILEVGTAAGGTLVQILKTLQEVNKGEYERVCVVDTFAYFENHQQIWEKNLQGHHFSPDQIDVRSGKSMDVFPLMARESLEFSFILIDAGHKLKDVIRDVRWLSLLKVGGVAAFHDYSERFPGVRLAVDLFLKRNSEFERIGLEGTLLLIRRKQKNNREVMPGWIICWMTFRSLLMQWEKSLCKRFVRCTGS